jgi:hypothetical protein
LVDEQYGIARTGQHMEVKREDVTEPGMGSTMDIQDSGIGRFTYARLHEIYLHRTLASLFLNHELLSRGGGGVRGI